MKNRNQYLRAMALSFFVLAISTLNFMWLSDSSCIRAIHIVTLLVCGMAIGVFLSNLFGFLRKK